LRPELPPRPDRDVPPFTPVPGSQVSTALDGRPLATWRVWEAVLVVLLGFFLGTIASIPVFALMKDTTQNGAVGPSELLQGVVLDSVILITVIVWLRRSHPTWRQIIGFPTRRHLFKEIVIGALLGLAVRFAAGVASVLVTSVLQKATGESVSLPEQVRSGMSGSAIALFALYAVIIAPIAEEFVFRGLIYRGLRDRWGVAVGAIGSAIPFGLIHYVGGQPWRDVVTLQLTMVVTGIGLALIYERRKTIVADIAGHAAFNLLAVVLIATGSAVVPGFLR
jgi:membrane protease YdiL (CAAX protease family)